MSWLGRRRRAGWGAAECESALPGVTSVPWARLRGVTGGPATEFPRLLAALILDPFDGLRDVLSEALGPSGLWAQATPYAIPFLIRVAQDVDHPRGADIAQLLLEEIAYGEPHISEIEAGNTGLQAEVEAALEEGRPYFEKQLRTGDTASKSQAIAILAGMDAGTGRMRQLLAEIDVAREDPLIAEAVSDAYRYLNGE